MAWPCDVRSDLSDITKNRDTTLTSDIMCRAQIKACLSDVTKDANVATEPLRMRLSDVLSDVVRLNSQINLS